MGAVKSAYSKEAYMLYYIERKDYDNISKLLDKHPELIELPITEKSKMTPLVRACFNGNIQMVKYLVEKCEANVNTVTEAGETALVVATRRYHAEIVRYLLSRGADVNAVTPVGLSTLQYAILPGFYEIALLIFERAKDRRLRKPEEYQQLASNYHYRYVNYEIFLDQLQKRVEAQSVPDFLKKEKKVYKDPVIDPRESWKEWTMRQIEFKDPPLVEREDLPQDLQPQNQKFGRLKHFFKNLTMSPMVTQKPKFHPETKSAVVPSANELNRSDPRTLEIIQIKSVP